MSTGKDDRRKRTLEASFRYFAKCNTKVATTRNLELQMSLETIKSAADDTGLEADHILSLVDAASSGNFTQNVSRQLIRCLIPKTKVPQEAVIKAISWMSTNKPPVAIQTHLLRWILVVYDYIDGYDKLHCLYGILFLFLDSQVMLPHVCHLLFLLTRKEDVKMFRVRKLLSLIQGWAGTQSCLIGLLTIYKMYYPNLVSFVLPTSNKMLFGSYDRAWRSQVRMVVDKAAKERSSALGHSQDAHNISASKSRQLAGQPPPRKKRCLAVPVTHSISTNNEEKIERFSVSVDSDRVPFVRIETFVNLLQNVHKIEFPSQIAACLRDPVLQHVLAYAGDRVVTARLTFWLQQCLNQEFLNDSPATIEEKETLLKLLVNLTDFLQEGIPVVDNFLTTFLYMWNGRDFCPYIFRLITKCQMYPFDELNNLILEPLRKLYFSSSVYFKCQCLLALTELLQNYAAYECLRLQSWTTAIQPDDQTVTPLEKNPSLIVLFPERINETVQASTVLNSLASFIDKLAIMGLQLEGDNQLLLHVCVNYVNQLSSLTSYPAVDHIILPSTQIVRFVLFSSSTSSISRLTAAFCRYKEAFVRITGRRRETVLAFNDMLVDVSDALWRNKAFNNPKQGSLKALAADIMPLLTSLSISSPCARFSIFQGQAFLSYAWNFFIKTQPEGKKVHPHQLKVVKDAYLEFLKQQHLDGIIHFINSFIMRKSAQSSTGE